MTLLPALPKQWPEGSLKNTRIRGGMLVNVTWADGKLSNASFVADRKILSSRKVNVLYDGKMLGNFETAQGARKVFLL